MSTSGPRSPTTLSHEESVVRNPTSLSDWLSYIKHATSESKSISSIFTLYERSLSHLPTCYNLWYAYVTTFRKLSLKVHPSHPSHQSYLNVIHRATHTLSNSPLLWSLYMHDLIRYGKLLQLRRLLSTILRALPLTQHAHIWRVIFHHQQSLPTLWICRMFERVTAVWPREYAVGMTKAFVEAGFHSRAQRLVEQLLSSTMIMKKNKQKTGSKGDSMMKFKPRGCTRAQLAIMSSGGPAVDNLIALVTTHRANKTEADEDCEEAQALYSELITTSAIHYARIGEFVKARNVLETGIMNTLSAHEFSIIFDAYTRLETTIAESITNEKELEQQIQRLESLVCRRPHLLSDTLLRQNPNNISEWLRRARLLKGNDTAVVSAYSTAIRTINPKLATQGKACTLWLAFAGFYTRAGEYESAIKVLNSGLQRRMEFKSSMEIALLWLGIAETEIIFGNLKSSYKVLQHAIQDSKQFINNSNNNNNGDDYDDKSDVGNEWWWTKIWCFLVDVVHAIGDPDVVVKVHEKMIDARTANAQSILSGILFLQNVKLYSRVSKLYDHAVNSLHGLQRMQIWACYIQHSLSRYAKQNQERIRHLFECCVQHVECTYDNEETQKQRTFKKKWKRKERAEISYLVKYIYIEYAEFEFKCGSLKDGLNVLKRGCESEYISGSDDMAALYRLKIVRTTEGLGVSAARSVYEEALKGVRDVEEFVEFAVRFARMEERLGEVQRARAIFQAVCGKVDTVGEGGSWLWKEWAAFESRCGDVEDFKEMLRFKRRVEIDFGARGARASTGSGRGGTLKSMIRGGILKSMLRGGELSVNQGVADEKEDGEGGEDNGETDQVELDGNVEETHENEIGNEVKGLDGENSEGKEKENDDGEVSERTENINVAKGDDGESDDEFEIEILPDSVTSKQVNEGIQKLMNAARVASERRKRDGEVTDS